MTINMCMFACVGVDVCTMPWKWCLE